MNVLNAAWLTMAILVDLVMTNVKITVRWTIQSKRSNTHSTD